ncbi:hypothetical protein QBC44DRAFT_388993 [Cladorrhinum sp. PSN332]|nr:hypothetical protein QBC44DRAFT_388993 [Cladorrhinum sp. PSN332]
MAEELDGDFPDPDEDQDNEQDFLANLEDVTLKLKQGKRSPENSFEEAASSPGEASTKKAPTSVELPPDLLLEDIRKSIAEWIETFPDDLKEMKKLFKTSIKKPVTAGEYETMVELREDQDWTPQDKVLLDVQMTALDYSLVNRERNSTLEQTWRLALRFLRLTPIEIFEGRHVEVAGAVQFSVMGVTISDPIWPRVFCERMRACILHPFFFSSPDLIALVVQYAVKLRTDDRRKSSKEVHQEVRERLAKLSSTSLVSQGFVVMENSVTGPAQPANLTEEPFQPYLVETEDLTAIRDALDNIRVNGAKFFPPGDFLFDWIKGGANTHDLPKGSQGATQAMKDACRRLVRNATVQSRRGLPAPIVPQPVAENDATRELRIEELQARLDASDALIDKLRVEVGQLQEENEELRAKDISEASQESGDYQLDVGDTEPETLADPDQAPPDPDQASPDPDQAPPDLASLLRSP